MKQQNYMFLLGLLMSMLGIEAFAHDIELANADGQTIYYVWKNSKTELEVSYRGSSHNSFNEYSGSIVIPQSVTYKGEPYPVTSVGELAFYGCRDLTSVTIPSSVTSIGNDAFSDCQGLTTLTIQPGMTSIGNGAFYGCSSLASVMIPSGLTSIGNEAFGCCSNLTSVIIPSSVTSIGSYAFGGTAWYNNQPDGFVYAGNVAYSYKGTMPQNTTIELKDGTLGIAGAAFYNCSSLTSVIIPSSVKSIGDAAFYNCSGLTSVTIPSNVMNIGVNAFYNCSSLKTLNILVDDNISVGENAFSGCDELSQLKVGVSKATSFSTLLNSIDCGKIKKITMDPQSINSFESDCITLIGSVLTNVETVVFGYCIRAIPANAFQHHNHLKEVDFSYPNISCSIGDYAFEYCTNLTKFNGCVNSLGDFCFKDTKLKSLQLAAENYEYYNDDEYEWETRSACGGELNHVGANPFLRVDNIIFDMTYNEDGQLKYQNYNVYSGSIFDKSGKCLVVASQSNVEVWGTLADYALCGSIVKNLNLTNVTTVGKSFLFECPLLEKITVSSNNTAFTTIDGVLYTKDMTELVKYPIAKNAEEVTIPASVTKIWDKAFEVSGIGTEKLRYINVEATIPPAIQIYTGDLYNSDIYVRVPYGCKAAYEAVEGWRAFKGIIEMPSSAIAFADANVKALCLASWDSNKDGKLSEEEAAAVTDLGEVFKGNTEITSFNELQYFTGVTTISPETFMGSSLESIVFPSTLTAIGYDAFRDCANLKSIDFNGCSAYVENQCFMGCSSLEEVYIPNSIQFRNSDLSWSWNTFGWCTSLKKVVFEAFGEEQTEYPARWSTTTMFNDCASLETVVLPSLTVVEHQFFQNCKNLKTVTILEVEDDFDTHLHNFDKKFGDSNAGQIQFIVPDGTAEKMLQAGYLYISDLGGLPLIRQEFEEEAARITTMADALTDGDKEALSAAISEARTTVNAAEDYATAYAQIAAIKTAAKTFLTTANYALGFDVTAAYINNPDFSKLQIGWSTPGDYVVWPDKNHRGYQGNIYENGDILIRDFIESWEAGYALQDGALSQVITNLPAGVYRLECDAIATWQGDDAVEVTGVSLFAGDSQTAVATANERPQHFSVEFTNLTTADVEIGIRAHETNANWMAADNFRLYHIDVVGDVSQFDNAIYIEPVSARIGGNVEVAICLKNAQSASAYKFDLVLPEGVTIAKGSNGYYIDALSARHSDHSRTLNYKEADKVYSFATLSGNSEALTGNDGAIRLVTLHVADDVAEGSYAIEIKNASYSQPDGTEIMLPNTITSITAESYVLGDVNGNSHVDIGDAVSVVNYLVGKPSTTFVEKAADTNKNGHIDIGDAVTIVNYLVGKTTSLSRSTMTAIDGKEPQ